MYFWQVQIVPKSFMFCLLCGVEFNETRILKPRGDGNYTDVILINITCVCVNENHMRRKIEIKEERRENEETKQMIIFLITNPCVTLSSESSAVSERIMRARKNTTEQTKRSEMEMRNDERVKENVNHWVYFIVMEASHTKNNGTNNDTIWKRQTLKKKKVTE